MEPKVLSEMMRRALEDADVSFEQIDILKFEIPTSSGASIFLSVFEDNDSDPVSYRVSGAVPGQVTQYLDKAVQILKNAQD